MKIYYFSMVVLLTCFLSSCSTISYTNGHYASSEAGALELSEKDDLKVSGSLSLSDIGDGFNAQAGYSPIKHVAIASSYTRISHNNLTNINNGGGFYNNAVSLTKFNLFEGSIGTYYFLPFKKQSKDIGVLFDLYTGYGLGKVKNDYGNDASSSLNFNQYYLQGGLHLRMKWFGISYLMRQTSLDYTKGNIDYVTWRSGYFQELKDLTEVPFRVKGSFLRMNFYVKPFQLYFTFSKIESNGFEDSIPPVSGIIQRSTFPLEMINIGVTTDINELLNFIKRNKKNKGKT